ncbi:MAG: DEAD/DEAH box helicase, partial [Acidobacteria bacterium]|nr:DEAD/DEAH box helicase [Acidobacteriota bacterium]
MGRTKIQQPAQELLSEIAEAAEFREMIRELVTGERPVFASGLTPAAKALYAVLARRAMQKPLLYMTRSNREAERAVDQLVTWARLLGEPEPVFLPVHDARPYQGLSPHADITEKRALALGKLAARQAPLVVIPVLAAATRMQAPEFYRSLARQIRRGQEMALEEVLEHLQKVGYTLQEPVEMVGQYSLRGGILDIFSPEARRPVRVELFGDEVESIREFDPESQRSVGTLETTTILPLTEFPPQREVLGQLAVNEKASPNGIDYVGSLAGWEFLVPLARPLEHNLFDLCEGAALFLDEPQDLREEVKRFWLLLEAEFAEACKEVRRAVPPEQLYLGWKEVASEWSERLVLHAEEMALSLPPDAAHFSFGTRPAPRFHGNVPLCLSEIRKLLEEEYRVLILTTGTGETDRLAELFSEAAIPFQRAASQLEETGWPEPWSGEAAVPACWIAQGAAPEGIMIPPRKLLVLGSEDLFDSPPLRPQVSPSKISTFLSDFRDLERGDYVVHVEHGIGCYRGLKEIIHEGAPLELMELEYLDGAKLYVPLARLDLVQKYRALEGPRPALDRLGGNSWARTKARVRKSMQEMAGELLKLYAERELASGHSFSGEDPWQREFEAAFTYEETPDQLTAIEDVRGDMEKPAPMDRLVCGDVGYGKTEVAMRAAFRAACHNKQAAVLAPTTVLALQHYETFRKRFAAFPVRIDLLSRFRTPAQQKETLRNLEAGQIDIVIGTHRLLSK